MNHIWLNAVRASGGALAWYRAGGAPAPVTAYQPIGAASLAASKINIVNPGTFDAATISGQVDPTWDANGWKREADAGFLSSGVVPAASSWTFIFRFSDFVGLGFRYIGRIAANRNMAVGLREGAAAANAHSYYNHGGLVIATLNLSGVYAIAGQAGYYNGSSEGAIPTAWTGTAGDALGLLGCPGLPTANWPTRLYLQAAAIYSSTLDAAQVAAVSAAMAALT